MELVEHTLLGDRFEGPDIPLLAFCDQGVCSLASCLMIGEFFDQAFERAILISQAAASKLAPEYNLGYSFAKR